MYRAGGWGRNQGIEGADRLRRALIDAGDGTRQQQLRRVVCHVQTCFFGKLVCTRMRLLF